MIHALASGDQYTAWSQGTQVWKEGKLASERGTWSFVGKTGKLEGIKGKGIFKGRPEGDSVGVHVEGEYALPR